MFLQTLCAALVVAPVLATFLPENSTPNNQRWYESSGDDCEPVCYPNIPCLGQCWPWVGPDRPLPIPEAPEDVCTTAVVYTPYQSNITVQIYPFVSYQVNTLFDKNLPTYIVTHGFLSSGQDYRFHEMAQALLGRGPANVFIIDWGKGSKGYANPDYLQAVANTRVAAAVTVNLIRKLKDIGGNLANFHFMGHSLGAHTLAYVCKKFPSECGRLTAWDAAGPLFANTPEIIRFSERDAKFTDAIHTNVGVLGIVMKIADVDFYVNNGVEQPVCLNPPVRYNYPSAKAYFDDFVAYLFACPHLASINYFKAAVQNPFLCLGRPTTVRGRALSDLNQITFGLLLGDIEKEVQSCNEVRCIPLGLETRDAGFKGNLQMATSDTEPYCLR